MGDTPGPVTDPWAGEPLDRDRALSGSDAVLVPVESIAEGLRIAESDTLAVSGLLLPEQREIWLNAEETRQSAGRRRFTIAHELGHWVCQVLEGHTAPIYCRAVDLAAVGAGPAPPARDRQLEREANVFAGELLMPEPTVRDEFPRADSVEAMAAGFGVSAEAMHWRLYSFGLLEEPAA